MAVNGNAICIGAKCLLKWDVCISEVQNSGIPLLFLKKYMYKAYRWQQTSDTLQSFPSLREIQPGNRTVSMDKCHLSSAPMPELQWTIGKSIWPEFRGPRFKSRLDLNVFFTTFVFVGSVVSYDLLRWHNCNMERSELILSFQSILVRSHQLCWGDQEMANVRSILTQGRQYVRGTTRHGVLHTR